MSQEAAGIALIEFDADGYPQAVVVTEPLDGGRLAYNLYYVDRSRQDGLCYHLAGGGPLDRPWEVSGAYWVRDDAVPVRELRSPADGCWRIAGERVPFAPRRLVELPPAWDKLGRDPGGGWELFAGMRESETEWCLECADCFASRDPRSDTLCPHIQWCAWCGYWSNPSEATEGKSPYPPGRCCHCGGGFEEEPDA